MNYILKFLEKTEKSKFLKFLYFLFLPLSYLFEYLCFKYYWNIIKVELLTNDDMVKFFEENEFGYKWYKLYKIDIVEPDTFLNQFNVEELKLKVHQEISEILVMKIKEVTSFDIEEYLNLTVKTDIVEGLKQFTVELKYFRFYFVTTYFKYTVLYILGAIGLFIYLKYFL